jgi:hypothetical protein
LSTTKAAGIFSLKHLFEKLAWAGGSDQFGRQALKTLLV